MGGLQEANVVAYTVRALMTQALRIGLIDLMRNDNKLRERDKPGIERIRIVNWQPETFK